MESNLDQIDWECLCKNPSELQLLETNIDKVDWSLISSKPAIFCPPLDDL
jgi:hypothetical protein